MKKLQDNSLNLDENNNVLNKKLVMLLLEKYNINPFSSLSVKDVATDLRMNQNNANQLFKRSDFPSLNFTKPKQICALSYYLWKLERRE